MKYERVRVVPGKTTKNAASEAAFQLVKATFQLGNLMGEVAPAPPVRKETAGAGAAGGFSQPPMTPPVLLVEGEEACETEEPAFRAQSPRRFSLSSKSDGSGSSSPVRKMSGEFSTKIKSKNKLGLSHPALLRRFSTSAVDEDLAATVGGKSGPSTPPGSKTHRRSFVGDLIDGVSLFRRSRSTSAASTGSKFKDDGFDDSELSPVCQDVDKDGFDHEVLSGFEYLDVTARYLMNLWRNEKVVSASEDEVQQALYGSNTDDDFIPELIGDSEIFDTKLRKHLIRVIPARCQGYPWKLSFSTSRDGFSLANLYRKMEGIDSCVLLVIKDVDHNVFGALLSDAPVPTDHFYGTGESFLFTFADPNGEGSASEPAPEKDGETNGVARNDEEIVKEEDVVTHSVKVDQALGGAEEPAVEATLAEEEERNEAGKETAVEATKAEDLVVSTEPERPRPSGDHFRVFKWSGENSLFIRCQNDSLAIGAGDGHFGIRLDGDLNYGRTDVCITFRNEILTKSNDFVILTLECWCFD